MESQNTSLSKPSVLESSVTQLILGEISAIMPLLSDIPPMSEEVPSSDMYSYVEMMMNVLSMVAETVNNGEIRGACFHILVSGLESGSPPLLVLPKLVDMAVMAGAEKEKEVTQILMGLLLDYKQNDVRNRI